MTSQNDAAPVQTEEQFQVAVTIAALSAYGFTVHDDAGGCTALATSGWGEEWIPYFLVSYTDDGGIPPANGEMALTFYKNEGHCDAEQDWEFSNLKELLLALPKIMGKVS